MPNYCYKTPTKYGKRAKELHKNAPKCERILWQALSALRKETKIHFRRQYPIPPYFADFACVKAMLVIELDGESHDARQSYDQNRDNVMRAKGWEVLRFTNDTALSNLEGCVSTIMNTVYERFALPTPNPSRSREGN